MAIARLSMKVGKAGQAGPHAAYIARIGQYASRLERGEKLESCEVGNMPAWAAANPLQFWQAADAHERANGTTYREMEIALPRELTPEQRSELVRAFVLQELGARHAYQWAVHVPTAADGKEQPHAHLMFSERQTDDVERDPEQYFRRYNAKAPEKGGARKGYGNVEATMKVGAARKVARADDLKVLRARWEVMCNAHLERAGHDARIDMRSYAARGMDRAPERKQLPSAWRGEGREQVLEHRAAQVELEAATLAAQLAVPDAAAAVVELDTDNGNTNERDQPTQRNAGRRRSGPPPAARGRLRSLSELPVVRIAGRGEVLLSPDVSRDLEHPRAERHPSVRRRDRADVTARAQDAVFVYGLRSEAKPPARVPKGWTVRWSNPQHTAVEFMRTESDGGQRHAFTDEGSRLVVARFQERDCGVMLVAALQKWTSAKLTLSGTEQYQRQMAYAAARLGVADRLADRDLARWAQEAWDRSPERQIQRQAEQESGVAQQRGTAFDAERMRRVAGLDRLLASRGVPLIFATHATEALRTTRKDQSQVQWGMVEVATIRECLDVGHDPDEVIRTLKEYSPGRADPATHAILERAIRAEVARREEQWEQERQQRNGPRGPKPGG